MVMETSIRYVFTVFPFLSILCIVGGIALFFASRENRHFSRRLLVLTAFAVLAVAFMELDFVWQEKAIEKGEEWKTIGLLEKARLTFGMPNGILPKTMQAFSLDAEYDEIFKIDSGSLKWYKVFLYSLVPIIGGAVIYDVLAGVSPYLRLFFKQFRRLYVFSELNEKTLCLAQSIAKNPERLTAPVLIFADCSQADTELTLRARQFGAICLADQLGNCSMLRHAKQCVFFLMSCGESGELAELKNLSLLQGLLNAERPQWPETAGCQIICFSNQDVSAERIRALKDAYKRRLDEDEAKRVVLHVVREYTQCANALMVEHPLFTGLVGKESDTPLRVVVVGNNALSRELYKTVFWCGQLLDHPLQLTAVYVPENEAGNETELEDWLKRNCPELLASCTAGDAALHLSFDESCADPYASLCFLEEGQDQLFSPAFLTRPRETRYGTAETFTLSDCDYFILAAGSDSDNITLADSLWRELVYLKRSGAASGKKTIAVAVENSSLSEIQRLRGEELRKKESDIVMLTFGSTAERYRWECVFTDGPYLSEHSPEQTVEKVIHGLSDIPETMDGFYDTWSELARHVHLPCRMFSAHLWKEEPEETSEKLRAAVRDKLAYCEAIGSNGALRDDLAWLEHRRWNAFLRTEGFRRPPKLTEKLRELSEGCCTDDGNSLILYAYKNIPARLHPNLVECFRGRREGERDLLDASSAMRQYVNLLVEGKEGPVDLKKYDYPSEKYGPRLSREELIAYLTDADPAAEGFDLAGAWKGLEKKYPAVKGCEDLKHPGYYYAAKVMLLRADRS